MLVHDIDIDDSRPSANETATKKKNKDRTTTYYVACKEKKKIENKIAVVLCLCAVCVRGGM